MVALPPVEEMSRAFLSGDPAYNNVFFAAVRTTGIFCRPSCPARKPLIEHVEFFTTPREALLAGYRPCKRCNPLNVSGRPPEWVAVLLDHIEHDPSATLGDADLRALAIDPARARRYFKRSYGMTFQAYRRARRMSRARDELRQGKCAIETALNVGYESTSGFAEAFKRTSGRAPSKDADWVLSTTIESPLGPLLACATKSAVVMLEFERTPRMSDLREKIRREFSRPVLPGRNDHLDQLEAQLAEYFAGRRRKFSVALDYPGTPFQVAVWRQLLNIPYGQTASYEDVAHAIGRPESQRAVGAANGRNRIVILIPCHRVVNKSGQLGGYGAGLWRKKHLLDLERQRMHGTASGDTIPNFAPTTCDAVRVGYDVPPNPWSAQVDESH